MCFVFEVVWKNSLSSLWTDLKESRDLSGIFWSDLLESWGLYVFCFWSSLKESCFSSNLKQSRNSPDLYFWSDFKESREYLVFNFWSSLKKSRRRPVGLVFKPIWNNLAVFSGLFWSSFKESRGHFVSGFWSNLKESRRS